MTGRARRVVLAVAGTTAATIVGVPVVASFGAVHVPSATQSRKLKPQARTAPLGTGPLYGLAQPSPNEAPDAPGSTPTTAAPTATPGPGTVTVIHVPSADNDVPIRDVYVYKPAGTGDAVLPVLYMLHGVPGDPQSMVETMRASLDDLFSSGAAPFEIAFPTGFGTARDDTEWADAVDGTDLVETYLLRNVIPAVEGSHPRTQAQRAIGGFSMGGYGATNVALRHPGLFGQVVSLSGYFRVDDPDGVFGGSAQVEAANAPDQNVQAAKGMRFLLLEDTDEPDPLIKGAAESFASQLDDCRCAAAVETGFGPGGHSYDFVDGQLATVAGFLAAGWSSASG